jgi:hypothetical protein
VWCLGAMFGQDGLVVDNDVDLLAVLRELGDPDWLEWPRSYDRVAAAERFASLTARLEASFAASTTSEQDLQDLSECRRVLVRAAATGRGTRIVVCVSKFGSMAVICAENAPDVLAWPEHVFASCCSESGLCPEERSSASSVVGCGRD